jgi:hypothetical protein
MIAGPHAAILMMVAIVGWGCAGDGTGLDEFGNPIGTSSELGPTLSSIQANIFTPICTQCHTGAAAPLGLALDAGAARQNLVRVPSVELSNLLRVDPRRTDSSYVVWKIEGRPGIVGGRMPLGLPPLSPAQIAAVRTWIDEGASAN